MGKRAAARKGTGACKSVAAIPTTAETSDTETALVTSVIPPDPVDSRLTLEGLKLGPDGKVDIAAYEDLVLGFKGEPSPDQHPDPKHPGLRRGEVVPKGLSIWDDLRAGCTEKDGAGWIAKKPATAHEKGRTKWFNIRACGSWRMAFLLARLQKAYWDERSVWLNETTTPSSGKTKATPIAEVTTVMDSQSKDTDDAAARESSADHGQASTPMKKRPTVTADEEGALKKPKVSRKLKESAPMPEKPPQKVSSFGADVFAGSERLKQILAARQTQQQK